MDSDVVRERSKGRFVGAVIAGVYREGPSGHGGKQSGDGCPLPRKLAREYFPYFFALEHDEGVAKRREDVQQHCVPFANDRLARTAIVDCEAVHFVLEPDAGEDAELNSGFSFGARQSEASFLGKDWFPSPGLGAVQAEAAEAVESKHGLQVANAAAADDGKRHFAMAREALKDLFYAIRNTNVARAAAERNKSAVEIEKNREPAGGIQARANFRPATEQMAWVVMPFAISPLAHDLCDCGLG